MVRQPKGVCGKYCKLTEKCGGASENYVHCQISPKEQFDPKSFRTISPNPCRRIVIGCPKGQYDPAGYYVFPQTGRRVRGKCRVGTRAQKIMRSLKKGCPTAR